MALSTMSLGWGQTFLANRKLILLPSYYFTMSVQTAAVSSLGKVSLDSLQILQNEHSLRP